MHVTRFLAIFTLLVSTALSQADTTVTPGGRGTDETNTVAAATAPASLTEGPNGRPPATESTTAEIATQTMSSNASPHSASGAIAAGSLVPDAMNVCARINHKIKLTRKMAVAQTVLLLLGGMTFAGMWL
jgi:hypothetical protein